MSWWDTDGGQILIGDRPADRMATALRTLAEQFERAFGQKPSLPEVLDGLGKMLLPPATAFAKTETSVISPVPPSLAPEAELIRTQLSAAARDIEALYRERWERGPTPAEITALAAFVIRGRAEQFVRDGEGLELDTIAVGARPTEASR